MDRIISKALTFIPQKYHDNVIRLIYIILKEESDPIKALEFLSQWTSGRKWYIGIHQGLQEYFHSLTRYSNDVRGFSI